MSIFTAPRIPHQSHRLQALEGVLAAAAIGAIVIAGYAWLGRSTETTSPVTTFTPATTSSEFGRPAQATRLTVYLVATQAEADYLVQALEDGNRIRAAIGEAPFNDTVFVTPTSADASRYEAIVAEGNQVLDGMRVSDVVVVRTGSLTGAPVIIFDAGAVQAAAELASRMLEEGLAMQAFPVITFSAPAARPDEIAFARAQHEASIEAWLGSGR